MIDRHRAAMLVADIDTAMSIRNDPSGEMPRGRRLQAIRGRLRGNEQPPAHDARPFLVAHAATFAALPVFGFAQTF